MDPALLVESIQVVVNVSNLSILNSKMLARLFKACLEMLHFLVCLNAGNYTCHCIRCKSTLKAAVNVMFNVQKVIVVR